ncbi:MAG: ChaN family lipoprotein [Nitrospirota bacterium]|jgi:uncharacterized iron-regulated protein
MKPLLSVTAVLVAAVALLYLGAGRSLGHYPVIEVKDMNRISFETLVDRVKGANIIFVGEQHDVAEHHAIQLALIKAIRPSVEGMALGMEMFKAEQQEALDLWVGGKMEEGELRKTFTEYWGLSWPLYRDILLYCRDEGIPIVALNVPKDITRKVADRGFASLTQEDLRRLPIGITCDVDKEYMEFIETVNRAHGRSGEGFVHFCEAQLLWDKVMAYRVVEYLRGNPGKTVVVLSGLVHSWKKGIPAQVGKSSDFTYKVILPLTPDTSQSTMNTDYADYFID